MPLPKDPKLLALAEDLLQQFDTLFGVHPGFRAAHAKGILLTGTFTPSPEARGLTKAPHITRDSTPVTARFSNSTGIPLLPDNDPNADPRGFAIRFNLAEHVHTDIVSHSIDAFPTRTPEEFLEMLRAVVASRGSQASPSPIEQFLGSHPAALKFVQAPKPAPASFAREAYFGVTAMRFINGNGAAHHGRYRILPQAGVEHLDAENLKKKSTNFLYDEIRERIAKGPVNFEIKVQIANAGDIVDDATAPWPEDRAIISFGKLSLTAFAPEQQQEQKKIIFDPIPRVDGIEASADPLLELRAAIYLMSGRRRRQAPDAAAATGAQ